MRLIDVGEMTAGLKGFGWVLQQAFGRLLERCTQDPIISAPDHVQGLGWQRLATTGEATAAGKRCQGLSPPRTLQMQRCDLFLRRAHLPIRISKGLAAKPATHPRATKKPGTKPIKQGWDRHGPARQPSRR